VFDSILIMSLIAVCSVWELSWQPKYIYSFLSFVFFFYLWLYLCTSLKLQWSIPDNPTDHSQSNNFPVTHSSNSLPYVTIVQHPVHNIHHRIPQWRNMNSHSRYFKIHSNFTLKSLPQSQKQHCPFMFPAHNIMLFSFPHTLYVHRMELFDFSVAFV
jgi:hypothetical protein